MLLIPPIYGLSIGIAHVFMMCWFGDKIKLKVNYFIYINKQNYHNYLFLTQQNIRVLKSVTKSWKAIIIIWIPKFKKC